MKNCHIFLAEGFEESEAILPIDLLRRAGVPVQTVSLGENLTVRGSHGIPVTADCSLEACLQWDGAQEEPTGEADLMIFPGGMPGSKNLAACEALMQALEAHYDAGGSVGAICAAPALVLSRLGERLKGKTMTCYAGFEAELEALGATCPAGTGCTRDGRIVTADGVGHALDFGLALVALLKGQAAADKVAGDILL